MKQYENNGVLSIRVGPNLKGVLMDIATTLKQEVGCPSFNAALVAILVSWVESHPDLLSPEMKFALKFDQMPRAGQK